VTDKDIPATARTGRCEEGAVIGVIRREIRRGRVECHVSAVRSQGRVRGSILGRSAGRIDADFLGRSQLPVSYKHAGVGAEAGGEGDEAAISAHRSTATPSH